MIKILSFVFLKTGHFLLDRSIYTYCTFHPDCIFLNKCKRRRLFDSPWCNAISSCSQIIMIRMREAFSMKWKSKPAPVLTALWSYIVNRAWQPCAACRRRSPGLPMLQALQSILTCWYPCHRHHGVQQCIHCRSSHISY